MQFVKVRGGFVLGFFFGVGVGFGAPMGNFLFMLAAALLN